MSVSELYESVAPKLLILPSKCRRSQRSGVPAPHTLHLAAGSVVDRSISGTDGLTGYNGIHTRVDTGVERKLGRHAQTISKPILEDHFGLPPHHFELQRGLISRLDLQTTTDLDSSLAGSLSVAAWMTASVSSLPELSIVACSPALQVLNALSALPGSASARQQRNPIQPSWRTHSFHWPQITNRFLEEQSALLADIGSTLMSRMLDVGNCLGVCGVGRQSGKSMLTICLARWLAKRLQRVMVVDADIDSANLTSFAGVDQRISWLDEMANSRPSHEGMIMAETENLTLAALQRPANPDIAKRVHELLGRITETTRKHFDCTLVDLGDVATLNSTVNGESIPVDGVILVHRDSEATAPEVELAMLRLRNRGIRPLAVIRNFAK
ncbi:MAG TPA: hypothetical protein PKD64_04180 [Pirellulaceae bacterium]|nr:hypothetical protein [Pirellulaceae bacterium]HMO91370.1 hypothetical protein [Pirellulaceae bacterium]HMP70238.1 hypothetical protein [Pirellulaceae bacterium]